jgi:hypothetical protein
MAFVSLIRTEELISILDANRARHRTVFEAALDGFHQEAVRLLSERAEAVRNGTVKGSIHVTMTAPADHSPDYTRVIRMMQFHLAAGEATIKLDEQDAARYILDDWEWSPHWRRLSSTYAGETYTTNYGELNPED